MKELTEPLRELVRKLRTKLKCVAVNRAGAVIIVTDPSAIEKDDGLFQRWTDDGIEMIAHLLDTELESLIAPIERAWKIRQDSSDSLIETLEKEIAALTTLMECGHPKACWVDGRIAPNDDGQVDTKMDGHCAVCVQQEQAVRDRDVEWWQELALVDNVAPEPKAVKDWLLRLSKHEQEEAVRLERAAALRDAIEQCDRRMKGVMANQEAPNREDFERCEAWRLVKDDILALLSHSDRSALEAHDAEVKLAAQKEMLHASPEALIKHDAEVRDLALEEAATECGTLFGEGDSAHEAAMLIRALKGSKP